MNDKPEKVGFRASFLSRAKSAAAKAFVSSICADVLQRERTSGARTNLRGPEAQSKFDLTIERFVGDLLNAGANTDSAGAIWHTINSSAFADAPISLRDFRAALDALTTLSLAEWTPGKGQYESFEGASLGQLPGRASRFSATPTLLERARDAGVSVSSIDDHFLQEPPRDALRLKKSSRRSRSYEKIAGASVRFQPTSQTERLEAQIIELNEFISRFEIGGAIHYGFERIFNEGDDLTSYAWNKGGRLYSKRPPSGQEPYQQLSGEDRARITIDGEETCEIDIRACNLTIFHAKLKVPLDTESDPYDHSRTGLERPIAKAWTVASFGANKPIARWSQQTSEEYLEQTLQQLDEQCPARVARDHMLAAYPALKELGKDGLTWADLMFAESTAIVQAMTALMVVHHTPSLPVHDSLIVPLRGLAAACDTLRESFRGILGVYPWVTTKSSNCDAQQVVQTANEGPGGSGIVSGYDL